MEKLDYKKAYRDLYLPKTKPMIIDIPKMNYIMVKGKGDPNEEDGDYKKSIQILYGITFTIKMSKKGSHSIDGYFDYVAPPLEGMWWMEGIKGIDFNDKSKFEFYSIMRLPEYVDEDVFAWACECVKKKNPEIDLSQTSFVSYQEGLCAQIMHKGSYDDEPATMQTLLDFLEEEGYVPDFDSIATTGQKRKHHEIYLSDPRKTKPENIKTVLRIPVKRRS